MTITEVQPIALAILTSIITGGFVLVFVEIGNRKSRENDRYEQIMRPFMHRLSALFRFVSWSRSYIEYPKQKDSYVEEFKNLVERIGNYGGRAIMSGGDYDVNYFTASKLEEIALDINNIWYYHDKMRPCKLSWQIRLLGTEELIKKELREINPLYLQEDMGVSLVAKVAAEFYTYIYQPIEYETYKHEACQKQYHRQTVLVTCYVIIVLLTLCLMLFVELPILLLQIVTAAVIMMLVSSLIMLAVDVLAQYNEWNKTLEFVKNKKSVMKYMSKTIKAVRFIGRKVVSFLFSKMVIAGLLLSAWAIFSLEIAWIPRIGVSWSVATVEGWNKVFLSLANSYVAGVILYYFTSRFPYVKNKKRLAPVIDKKINSIGNQLLNMSLEFRNLENPDVSEVDAIMDLIATKRWTEACRMPYHARRNNVTEAFVYDYHEVKQSVSLLINDYKEYLSAEQLILLESLRESQINMFSSMVEGQGQGFVFSDFFYEQVMKPSYRMLLETYNKLAKSL